jgi:hypothetical protein
VDSLVEQTSESPASVEQTLSGTMLDAERALSVPSAAPAAVDGSSATGKGAGGYFDVFTASSSKASGQQKASVDESSAAPVLKASDVVVEARKLLATRGNGVALNLRDVLKYSFTYVFVFVCDRFPVTTADSLTEVVSEKFADDVVSWMQEASPTLVKYVEECLSRKEPWDTRKIRVMLENGGSLEQHRSRHGVYLVLLNKVESFWHVYGGSAAGIGVKSKGIVTRLENHMNSKYRAQHHEKYLYQFMDGDYKTELARPVLLLPQGYIARNGVKSLLVMETVVAALFGTWRPEGVKGSYSKFFDVSSVYPHSLVKAYAEFCNAQENGPRIALSDSNVAVMKKALGFVANPDHAAGIKVLQGGNSSLPLSDSRMYDGDGRRGEPSDISALLHGVEKKLYRDGNSCACMIVVPGRLVNVSTADMSRLFEGGFSWDMPHVTLSLYLAEGFHPENYAQVREHGESDDNTLGFEIAHRIVLQLAWTAEDFSDHQINVRMPTARRCALERACFAMSLYEYAVGELPSTDDRTVSVGRRRTNLLAAERDDDIKAWHEGQPEMSVKLIQCKFCLDAFSCEEDLQAHQLEDNSCSVAALQGNVSRDTAKAHGIQLWRCPACKYEAERFNRVKMHMLSDKNVSCRRACGVRTAEDIDGIQRQCVIDESLLNTEMKNKLGINPAPPAKALACKGCNFTIGALHGCFIHLGFKDNKGNVRDASYTPTKKQLACRKACGTTVLADVTLEALRNPAWQPKRQRN